MGVWFSVENEGGVGQAKEPASHCARVCQNHPLVKYPLLVSFLTENRIRPISRDCRDCRNPVLLFLDLYENTKENLKNCKHKGFFSPCQPLKPVKKQKTLKNTKEISSKEGEGTFKILLVKRPLSTYRLCKGHYTQRNMHCPYFPFSCP